MPVRSEPPLAQLRVRSSSGDYEVAVGRGSCAALLANHPDVVIADRMLAPQLRLDGEAPVVWVDADEQAKTLAGCEQVVLALREAGVRRGHHVVAVGGGVVQDIATFVTDIYMRGLPWTYLPTTLMAMADSCIGGKSSINAGGVKNLVGGFHPPARVVVDPVFLDTLTPVAISAGLAEAVKICYCRGAQSFQGYLERHEVFAAQPAELLTHVLDAKRWFIEVDEHDRAERLLLNFGHTFGHALEAATGHRLSHGVAVAVGILCALAHPGSVPNATGADLEAHCRALLAPVDDLAQVLCTFDEPAYERAFRSDKKHSTEAFRLILPAPGEGVRQVETPSDTRGWDAVLDATRTALASLSQEQT